MILSPPQINFFRILGLKIHFYSLLIFSAVLICFCLLFPISKKLCPDADREVIYDFAPLLVVAAVIGARLYYVLLSFDYYLYHPLEILMVWRGGLSIHGAFFAGVLLGIFYFKAKKLPFFIYADLFSLVFPLGQAIGRWGNFFNSEAFGLPVFGSAPFLLYVEEKFRPAQFANCTYFHPAFLYECFFDLLIFFVLLFLMKKTAKKYDGLVFFSYIFFYSIIRSILEFIRLDSVSYVCGIPTPALVSFVGILVGIFGILWRLKSKKLPTL